MANATIRIGEKFNRLKILDEFKDGKNRKAKVICECGTEKTVVKAKVVRGEIKSCGCLSRETAKRNIENTRRTRVLTKEARSKMGGSGRFKKKHGMKNSPEYSAWNSMINRCENPKSCSYKTHGARGISVCRDWRDSFEIFFKDMGVRPSKNHSIDRIDNDGDYTPENCRWATRTEQQSNKGNNRVLAFNGKEMSVAEWSEELGIPYSRISKRLQYGWSDEKCLTTK